MAYTDIDKPSDYFETKLYTGNGGTLNVTGLDFSPNWVWIKSRSSSRVHCLFDTVRSATKRLQTNEADTEYTTSNSLTGFNSDGFSLGSYNQSNEGSANFVSWNWKAETSFTNSAGSNGATIASAGSVNTDAGFSFFTYTGNGSDATVFHSLSVVPNVILVKSLNATGNWHMYHSAMGNDKNIVLNTTAANYTSNNWKKTNPTSSVFSLKSGTFDTNINGRNYICYTFANKQGYSKFGSYTGNGNADGTFVYTGFKPAFIIQKEAGNTRDWTMIDNTRSPFNAADDRLVPNTSNAEVTNNITDLLSNGFKMRNTQSNTNGNGSSYIYMAFAENPFVTSTGVPATAR